MSLVKEPVSYEFAEMGHSALLKIKTSGESQEALHLGETYEGACKVCRQMDKKTGVDPLQLRAFEEGQRSTPM